MSRPEGALVGSGSLSAQADKRPQPESRPQLEGQVLCKACGAVVTQPRHRLEVSGNHEHTFRNPWGYSFHLLCFGEASGAVSEGAPTAEASWFAGYQWSFATCGQCRNHLGWFYHRQDPQGGPERFVGLIATRLLRP